MLGQASAVVRVRNRRLHGRFETLEDIAGHAGAGGEAIDVFHHQGRITGLRGGDELRQPSLLRMVTRPTGLGRHLRRHHGEVAERRVDLAAEQIGQARAVLR